MTTQINKAFSEIPVIDISGLYSTDLADQQRVANELGHAAQHVGFF
jgi:isopenicillin N synthase-like dioxygenase